ncbi:polysaccharide export protein [Sphingomonas sinipercae]|uniref:Polysaccharide export protein n=1 Tax=Sphingomonas sinipercae TaxID=2714944 RepID=A0A6G7ZN53_9SPHN|nr:polysaccharide biosynthesis/export family protein [Sphingomonas sinipercae]QIL02414.1 polysaccharide export protein [Sphingomonas sinipercae]
MSLVEVILSKAGRLLMLLLLGTAAFAASGCGDKRGGPIPYDPSSFGAPDSATLVPLEQGYKIAPMDTLSVKVFKMTDLTGDYQVDLLGNISMPLIGEVPAANKTPEELDRLLTARFGEKYLENPDVSIGIKSSARRNVTVDGAVKSAGAFPVNGPMTLMQAVALAGGLTEDANARRVAVFRQISGTRQAAAFDLVTIRRGETPDPQIYSGDIVVVDGSSVKATQKKLLNALPVFSIFRPF